MARDDGIGLAVLGCGLRATVLLAFLARASSRAEVRAILDPDDAQVARFRERVPGDYRRLADLSELGDAPDVDWVLIASWNRFHREQACAALAAGKHVFCEKPLATSLEDGLAMARAWRRSDRRFMLGFGLRYAPFYRRLHELVASGRIGRLVSLEFNETLDWNHGGYIMGDWRRLTRNAGTHLLEKCCHDVDLASWVVGSRAARVASFGGTSFFVPENAERIAALGRDDAGREAYRVWPGAVNENPFTADKDVHDHQVVILEYQNGVRASFHTNCNAALPERRFYLCGSEGAIRADLHRATLEVRRIGFSEETETIDAGHRGELHGGAEPRLCAEWAACMEAGREPSAGLREGLESAATCFAADAAAATGRVVELADDWRAVDAALAGDQSSTADSSRSTSAPATQPKTGISR